MCIMVLNKLLNCRPCNRCYQYKQCNEQSLRRRWGMSLDCCLTYNILCCIISILLLNILDCMMCMLLPMCIVNNQNRHQYKDYMPQLTHNIQESRLDSYFQYIRLNILSMYLHYYIVCILSLSLSMRNIFLNSYNSQWNKLRTSPQYIQYHKPYILRQLWNQSHMLYMYFQHYT